jgi:hypothetical protein
LKILEIGVSQDRFGGDIEFLHGMDQMEKFLLLNLKKKHLLKQKKIIEKKLN